MYFLNNVHYLQYTAYILASKVMEPPVPEYNRQAANATEFRAVCAGAVHSAAADWRPSAARHHEHASR